MALTVSKAVDFGSGIIAVDFTGDIVVQLSGGLPFRDPYHTAYQMWIEAGNAPEPPGSGMLLGHAQARRIQTDDAKALKERLAKPDATYDKIAKEIESGAITTTAQIDEAFGAAG